MGREEEYGLPMRTDEQRAEALRMAARARHERAEMLRGVKRGEVDPLGVLARRDPVATRTRVMAFLEALPGYGPVSAERLMRSARISRSRRLGGLGRRQREALEAAIRDGAAGRAGR